MTKRTYVPQGPREFTITLGTPPEGETYRKEFESIDAAMRHAVSRANGRKWKVAEHQKTEVTDGKAQTTG